MECILNLSDIKFENRNKHVFFASTDIIIYKEMLNIVMANCSGEIITTCPCPRDYRNFEVVDLEDSVLIVAAGKYVILLDKLGNAPIRYELDTEKLGRVITKLYSVNNDSVVFGTKRNDVAQIINYDFIGQKRLSQSASWKVRNITDLVVAENKVYALLDSSFLVACDTSSCEPLWNRFEAGFVYPYIVPYKGGILYACQGLIRQYREGSVDTLRVPLSNVSSLITCLDDKLIFTSDNSTNIGSYSLRKDKLVWEIVGADKILEAVPIKGQIGKEIFNTLAIRVDGRFGLVNLDLGRSAHYGKCSDVYRIRQTADHILLHKARGQTDMLAGISG